MTFVYTETRPLTAGNTLIFLRTLMNDYIFLKYIEYINKLPTVQLSVTTELGSHPSRA